MVALIAEGASPEEYGFAKAKDALSKIRYNLIGEKQISLGLAQRHWNHIQKRLIENAGQLKSHPYWSYISWLLKLDLDNIEKQKAPLVYRVRKKLATFKFYQMLHKVKERFL